MRSSKISPELAAINQQGGSFAELLPWLLLLVGIVVVGAVAISFVRRWMKDDGRPRQIGFTLTDLRQMHADGRLSKEELDKAEQHLIKKVRSTMSPEDLARRDEIRASSSSNSSKRNNPTSEG
ncbi:MAG: hypothetical protein CBC35_01705 [Planctomycetes bacterium TMED75]|nr:hypothetical protein [Planctomycetaceae bacterium]OUU96274.1 MAG: hypothetical protein CBC35_01705 [Planctomycetes bacterium TMED75]